ncbi:MAG: hypothetical protein LAT62_02710 [Natronospirillum sp.]|uniref:hypothetical protein n=1 Tax=Natronospirillum sp. TaxID=2812955 RepID=UPI0025E14901|nr:hypothetical protein [Natronospirillum sp.]MCH8550818.1 hypothetical protein [Natronospirillum sp.]
MPTDTYNHDAPIEPGRDAFLPALGVMVAGHRQPRLVRQGQTPPFNDIAVALKQVLLTVQECAAEAFKDGHPVYRGLTPAYRLFTGDASGTDETAAQLAEQCGYRLNIIAPGRAADAAFTQPEARRAIALGMRPTRHLQRKLRQEDYSLRDDLALCFSDLMIAVWDGEEPFPMRSGTALAVRTALLRRTPVVWIQPRADQPPRVHLTDPERLTDTALAELEVLGATPDMVQKLFSTLPADSAAFRHLMQRWMRGLLLPFADSLDDHNPERRQREVLARQHTLPQLGWQWVRHLSGRHPGPAPPNLWQWWQGFRAWLRAMVDTPRPSPGYQVLEYLTMSAPPPQWHERITSRLHTALASLIKTSPSEVRERLRQSQQSPPPRQTEPEPDSPIREQFLPHYFAFGEQQARRCAMRYRDDTWLIFYAAAMAVFCAVAGAIYLWPASIGGLSLVWVILEFLLLRLIVSKVLGARLQGWHRRWMGYRFMTEQLRILRLGFPLLVLPDCMRQRLWTPDRRGDGVTMRPLHPESWILQRILIAEGLPRSATGKPWFRITHHNEATLNLTRHALSSNRRYFAHLHHKLHEDHHRLHRFSLVLFGMTFLAVLSHFLFTLPGILFFTAFFPAWGAAIHGVLNQNEVARVSAMAQHTLHQLRTLDTALTLHRDVTESGIQINDEAEAWARTRELRGLVSALTETLETENRQWVSLLQHNEPDLPG